MVWDLPTRIFHWGFAISIIGAFISGERGALTAHELFGLSAFGLIIFRFIWGLIGFETARFRHFVPSLQGLLAYMKIWRARRKDIPHSGHNPFGAVAVIVLLAVMAVMAVTGLWTGDDVLYEAPLTIIGIAPEWAAPMGAWHEKLHFLVPLLVIIHLSAIIAHRLWLGERLVARMLTGGIAPNKPTTTQTAYGLVLLALCVGGSLSMSLLTPNYG